MKTLKNKLCILFLAILAVACGVFGVSALQPQKAEAEATPAVTIESNNLSYSDSLYLIYAVSNEGFDRKQNQIQLLFWEEPQEEYTYGTQDSVATTNDKATVKGKDCLIYYSRGLAAKEMTTDLYARAYVNIDGMAYYSEVSKFSVFDYVYTMRDYNTVDSTTDALFTKMLDYGAQAQLKFNHKTDKLANAPYYKITASNGTFEDGREWGRFYANETVTLVANPAPEGYVFAYWINKSERIVCRTESYTLKVTASNDYTAVYTIIGEDISSQGLSYTLNADGLGYTVSGIGSCKDTAIVIPAEYNMLPVTAIANSAFYYKSNLTSVVIPDSVTSIGAQAFYSCDSLASVVIGDSVTSIGEWAFYGCDSLTSVVIPDSVTSIGSYAFYYCSSLTSVVIPDSVMSIGERAFYYCTALTEIKYNATELADLSLNNSIFSYAGQNGEGVTVTIGANVKRIPAYIFWPSNSTSYVPQITKVVFEEGSVCESIGAYAFYYCSSLTSINIPDSVTTIGEKAFYYCSSLTSINIPDGITSIGESTFYNCSSLTSVEIPDSVTSIGKWAFYNGTALTEIKFSATYLSDFVNANDVFHNAGINGEGITVTFTDNVTRVPSYLFSPYGMQYSPKIKTIIFEEGSVCESIGNSAFYGCSSLTSVEIPDSVTSIGYEAFSSCSSLTSVVIPDSVTSIGEWAFSSCSNLKSLTIGEGVSYIGKRAFYTCSALTELYFNAIECEDLYFSASDAVFDTAGSQSDGITVTIGAKVKRIPGNAFYSAKVSALVFEEGSVCEYIGGYLFYNCKSLTRVDIGAKVTCIGANAFNGCSNLTAVYITDIAAWCNITFEFDYYASPLYLAGNLYLNNELVTDLVLPDGVTKINKYAFYRCNTLTSIVIPKTVTSIENTAFYSCPEFTTVYYGGTESEWGNITIGSNNEKLTNATRYYYSESEPSINSDGTSYDGNYWHYVDGEVTVWIQHSHIYQEAVTKPTCTEGGYTTYTCSGCGDTYTGNFVTATGHSFEDYQCTVCNEWDYTPIDYFEISVFDGEYRIGPKQGIEYPETVVLPNTYNGQPITTMLSFQKTSTSYLTSNIRAFIITDGYEKIVGSAFCYSTTYVKIPASVTDIQYGSVDTTAFFNAMDLTCIEVDEDNAYFKSIDGVLFNKEGTELLHFPQEKPVDTYTVADTVTVIGRNAFREATLDEVVLHEGITEIKPRAFIYATITKITLPSQITYIGEYTFDSCEELTEIIIPDGVVTMDSFAFSYCDNLASIVIPNSITSIGSYAFYYSESLESVYYGGTASEWGNITIGSDNSCLTNATRYYYSETQPTGEGNYWHYVDGVVTIWENLIPSQGLAFSLNSDGESYTVTGIGECTDTDLVIPSTYNGKPVTAIGGKAFSSCTSLTSMVIPDSVTSIGNEAFADCRSLTSVVIPDSVTSIGNYAFSWCSSLTSVVIPDSVTSIGSYAFYSCDSLTSVVIPDSVTSIGEEAFYSCDSLTSVVIGDSVTSIGYDAFYSCSSLTSVVIPNSVTSIGEDAFYGCSSLTSIEIPESVTSIGSYAFSNCKALTEIQYNATELADFSSSNYVFSYAGQNGEGITVTIGANVKKIPAYIFVPKYDSSYAPKITTVIFEEGSVCESIGSSAFYNCSSLTNIYITDIKAWVGISGLSNLMNYSASNKKLYLNDELVTELVIPDSVTSIGEWAFYRCSSLTSVVIPDSVTSIGNSAFNACFSLTSVVIPDSVTSIGNEAFADCRSLTSVVIPDSVTSIAGGAFYRCSSLTSVVIPDSVTSIGAYAFSNCSSLTSVVIPDSVTSIGNYAFSNCSSLTSVVISDSVTSIGYEAFQYCSSLKTVYYGSTESEWGNITIGSYNTNLTNATRYYYSETQPTVAGKYWHFVDGVVTIW